MALNLSEEEPSRRRWLGFWAMIVLQTQNAFSDKLALFTLIPLAGAVGFGLRIPSGKGLEMEVMSAAGLMMALPMVFFAPLAGWVSDRFPKRNVMLCAAICQALVLAWICGAVALRNLPLALGGFFALATQATFFSPAKFGINKELVGAKYLGFASGIQQKTAMLAILAGQIFGGWWFDQRLTGHGGGTESAWQAAFLPLLFVTGLAVPGVVVAWTIPRLPALARPPLTRQLATRHFQSLAELWRDPPLRRAALGVAFFWGFAAFINLWAVKLAKVMTGGGEGFGTQSSIFMAAASLGMAAGFGFASFLMRRRIELGWVPTAGLMMTLTAFALSWMQPRGSFLLPTMALLAFSAAVFLVPLHGWMQDRYPAEKRGELQAAVNLQDCLAGIFAVILSGALDYGAKLIGISAEVGLRLEIAFVGLICGAVSLFLLHLLPGDFIRLVGGMLVRTIYQIQTAGPEHVPAKGGALLLPNHITFADGFFITAASPRPVRFVMDEAFVASRTVRIFTRIFNTVTIRRDQPREAIRITIDALKNGDLVCLFPEGQLTRTGTLSELRRGFELIARKAGHPLIPMWIDGSWGSIFSFERGSFFSKIPYRLPFGVTVAFGTEIPPGNADLATVRQGMLVASATAMAKRFSATRWGTRIPARASHAFRTYSESSRRQAWINGHQIGQINALQRRTKIFALGADPLPGQLFGLSLTFSELFSAPITTRDLVDGNLAAAWVGGETLRTLLGTTQLAAQIQFYDFGADALTPCNLPGLVHCPCLAIRGAVIAMSMPDPTRPAADSEPQSGSKLGTWGKLLPGWFLLPAGNGHLRAHGPAAPDEGLELPLGAFLDPEGFLGWNPPDSLQ